jgi:hypothetical protein
VPMIGEEGASRPFVGIVYSQPTRLPFDAEIHEPPSGLGPNVRVFYRQGETPMTTLNAKILAACLLTAALPTMAAAQVVNERAPGQPVPAQGQPVAVDSQHQTQEAIAHALGMAICGSELQFTAQSAQGGRRQNQNADDNNRNRDNADNNQNRDDNQGRSQAQRAVVQQLRQQAWQQFESSSQLLQATDTDLRASEANRAGDRSAWSRRLLTVANQYATNLRNLSGANNRPANTVGGQNDQDQANNKSNENQNQNQGGNNMSRTEVAQVTLINHAVNEAIQAFELSHPNNASRFVAQNASGQRLQAHARQMSSGSQQLLQNVISNANWRQNDNQGEQRGQASVQSLAQQAQQIIETLQRIGGNTTR